MKNRAFLFAPLVFAASPLLGNGLASAQWHDESEPSRDRYAPPSGPQEQPGSEQERSRAQQQRADDQYEEHRYDLGRGELGRARPRPVDRTGTIASLAMGPSRGVRSLTLTDGALVVLRGGDSSTVRRLQRGQLVRVSGMMMPNEPGTIRDATVTTLRPSRFGRFGPARSPVVARVPAPVVVPIQAPAASSSFSLRAAIQSVGSGSSPGAQTLFLSDGHSLALQAGMARALEQHGIDMRELVFVTGHANPVGGTLIADSITFSDGATVRAARGPRSGW